VKSFVVPNIDAQCPTWQVPVFGKDIGFTNHCALLEQTRPTLVAVMAASLWSLLGWSGRSDPGCGQLSR
jgi:hypothetical protein